jgi:hypothetical protein
MRVQEPESARPLQTIADEMKTLRALLSSYERAQHLQEIGESEMALTVYGGARRILCLMARITA